MKKLVSLTLSLSLVIGVVPGAFAQIDQAIDTFKNQIQEFQNTTQQNQENPVGNTTPVETTSAKTQEPSTVQEEKAFEEVKVTGEYREVTGTLGRDPAKGFLYMNTLGGEYMNVTSKDPVLITKGIRAAGNDYENIVGLGGYFFTDSQYPVLSLNGPKAYIKNVKQPENPEFEFEKTAFTGWKLPDPKLYTGEVYFKKATVGGAVVDRAFIKMTDNLGNYLDVDGNVVTSENQKIDERWLYNEYDLNAQNEIYDATRLTAQYKLDEGLEDLNVRPIFQVYGNKGYDPSGLAYLRWRYLGQVLNVDYQYYKSPRPAAPQVEEVVEEVQVPIEAAIAKEYLWTYSMDSISANLCFHPEPKFNVELKYDPSLYHMKLSAGIGYEFEFTGSMLDGKMSSSSTAGTFAGFNANAVLDPSLGIISFGSSGKLPGGCPIDYDAPQIKEPLQFIPSLEIKF